jgi:phage tail-like protein
MKGKPKTMAIKRDRPYRNFNFLVDLGTGETAGPDAGFEEVLLPEARIDVIEYRNGNDKANEVLKLPGLARYGNVILRRGLIGSLSLYQWWNEVRNGNTGASRNVVISLQSEDHSQVVMTWKLLRAWPVRYKAFGLSGKGQEVAMEELELAFERLEIE